MFLNIPRFVGPVDLMLATLVDRLDGCYTAYPFLAHVPVGTDGIYSDDSDVQDHARTAIAGAPA